MSPRGWQRLLLSMVVIGIGAIIVRETSPSVSSVSTAIGHAPSGVSLLVAASLAPVVTEMAPSDRLNSGNSDALAAQVIEGVPADVFVAADLSNPEALYSEGLAGKPVVIAHDRLVIITPAANPAAIHSVGDLTRRGVHLVVGAAGSAIGRYTQSAFAKLGLSRALTEHGVSRASDTGAITTDVVLGHADAGVVYESQARALGSRVKTVAIPAGVQPLISDVAVVMAHAPNPTAAAAFVAYLGGPNGQAYLRRYGFLAP